MVHSENYLSFLSKKSKDQFLKIYLKLNLTIQIMQFEIWDYFLLPTENLQKILHYDQLVMTYSMFERKYLF